MSIKKLESKIVSIPNVGQFLVEYVEANSQAYANKPTLGFNADVQKKPIERPPNELEIWNQHVEDYIKWRLGIDESDIPYKGTKIGFGTEAEKPPRYDIKITPINHIIVPQGGLKWEYT